MSAICYCKNAKIKESPQGEKYCTDCGHWWNPKHGSTEPDGKSRKKANSSIFVEKFETYVKIKEQPCRNAGCPCGSGKKYKKCCINLQPTKKP